jgi:hypothetical protein
MLMPETSTAGVGASSGLTRLRRASLSGHMLAIKALIVKRAEVNAEDDDGQTARAHKFAPGPAVNLRWYRLRDTNGSRGVIPTASLSLTLPSTPDPTQ